MKLIDNIENKTSNSLYKSLTKQLRNSKTLESQKNILKDFYKNRDFTRGELIGRMRELERGFKYDSTWYGEQYVGLVFGFFLGGFIDLFSGKLILTFLFYALLFFVFSAFLLKKDLRKYRKDENRLYEINHFELDLIKTILTKNEPKVDVATLIEQISLDKLYFKE